MRAGVDAVAGQVVHLVPQAATDAGRGAVAADGAAPGALGLTAAVAALRIAVAAAAHLHQVQRHAAGAAGLQGSQVPSGEASSFVLQPLRARAHLIAGLRELRQAGGRHVAHLPRQRRGVGRRIRVPAAPCRNLEMTKCERPNGCTARDSLSLLFQSDADAGRQLGVAEDLADGRRQRRVDPRRPRCRHQDRRQHGAHYRDGVRTRGHLGNKCPVRSARPGLQPGPGGTRIHGAGGYRRLCGRGGLCGCFAGFISPCARSAIRQLLEAEVMGSRRRGGKHLCHCQREA